MVTSCFKYNHKTYLPPLEKFVTMELKQFLFFGMEVLKCKTHIILLNGYQYYSLVLVINKTIIRKRPLFYQKKSN